MLVVKELNKEVAEDILLKTNHIGKQFLIFKDLKNVPNYMYKRIKSFYIPVEFSSFCINNEFCIISKEYGKNLKTEIVDSDIDKSKLIIHDIGDVANIREEIYNLRESSKGYDNVDFINNIDSLRNELSLSILIETYVRYRGIKSININNCERAIDISKKLQ